MVGPLETATVFQPLTKSPVMVRVEDRTDGPTVIEEPELKATELPDGIVIAPDPLS
jgi:hypothetical protein